MKIKYFEEGFPCDLWWKHYILRINVTKVKIQANVRVEKTKQHLV